MITPGEAFGIQQCIELLGKDHPTSIFLATTIAEVNLKEGTEIETQAGVDLSIKLCIEKGIVYVNQANLSFLFTEGGTNGRPDKPKATVETGKHSKKRI